MLAPLTHVSCRQFWRAASLTAVLAAAVFAGAGCGGPGVGHGPGAVSTASDSGWKLIRGGPLRSLVVLDDGATFAPPPAWAKPKLTGVQAWDKSFLGGNKATPRPIPPDVSYQFGLLTVPPSVTDVPAWGFSAPPGPCPLPAGGPALAHSSPAPSPSHSPRGRCIGWTFINANNASNPAGTWQRLNTPAPSPSPTPVTVVALHSGGFVSDSLERYSPQRLEVQGPLSTIRWTFWATNCSLSLHWFIPPQTQQGPARASCPWRHEFSLSVVTDFTSRGHVFSAIGGYVAHPGLVRAVLADGKTWIYDAQDENGAWLFAVQRCGDFHGTAIRAVEEMDSARHVIARLKVPAASHPQGPAGCRSLTSQ